jgi:hypothetical protein
MKYNHSSLRNLNEHLNIDEVRGNRFDTLNTGE